MEERLDFKRISVRLYYHFALLIVIMLILVWALQIFSLNYYYESMKTNEITKVAKKIETEFISGGRSIGKLDDILYTYSASNDITIFVTDASGNVVLSTEESYSDFGPEDRNPYSDSIANLRDRLLEENKSSTSDIAISRDKSKTFEYAFTLTTNRTDSNGDAVQVVMYIFSPLYPVKSTISILRTQLINVSIISLLLAFVLSFYFSHRLSRPIKNITRSATELANGNFNVKFDGGGYTELDELAETLTVASSEMEKNEQYQRDLMANVSHDLRTPLTMIRSYAEMIRDLSGNNPEKREAHLNVIIEETERLNSLVNDMLDLTRMQQKRTVLDKEPVELGKSVSSMMTTYEALNETDGYNISFHLGKGPFIVLCDEAKIKQVISNFMGNAIKYGGEDKVVIAELKRYGRRVRFSVTDHGQGIAPEDVPHVWDKYYKSSKNHSRGEESSGLGLSIAKEILKLHSASFDVESKVGKGSTFWFELSLMKSKKENKKDAKKAKEKIDY